MLRLKIFQGFLDHIFMLFPEASVRGAASDDAPLMVDAAAVEAAVPAFTAIPLPFAVMILVIPRTVFFRHVVFPPWRSRARTHLFGAQYRSVCRAVASRGLYPAATGRRMVSSHSTTCCRAFSDAAKRSAPWAAPWYSLSSVKPSARSFSRRAAVAA